MQWELVLLDSKPKILMREPCTRMPPKELYSGTVWPHAISLMKICQTLMLISTTINWMSKSVCPVVTTLKWTFISEPPSLRRMDSTWTSPNWKSIIKGTSLGTLLLRFLSSMSLVTMNLTSKRWQTNLSRRPKMHLPVSESLCSQMIKKSSHI